jgi:hypothetical protein
MSNVIGEEVPAWLKKELTGDKNLHINGKYTVISKTVDYKEDHDIVTITALHQNIKAANPYYKPKKMSEKEIKEKCIKEMSNPIDMLEIGE